MCVGGVLPASTGTGSLLRVCLGAGEPCGSQVSLGGQEEGQQAATAGSLGL